MTGRTLQNYRIERLIGEGGMGVVYKATDITLERTVAIKVLHNHLVKDSIFYNRFRNEAVLLARLNHPNVTTLYNFFSEENQSFMVMEYVEGITLEALLKQEKVLACETVIRIISAAANGLQHAHERGILHRDIKPSNIMISGKGEVKLMDFGIAKMKGSASLTRTGSIIGTLEYIAPELLNGVPPSVHSDLYAMGIVMYELLTGKLPFEGSTEASLINSIVHRKPLPLRTYTTGVPKELESILDNLLKKKPERRISSAEELKSLLQKVPVTKILPEYSGHLKKIIKKIRREAAGSTGKMSRAFIQSAGAFPRFLNSQEGYIASGGIIITVLILIFGSRSFSLPEARSVPPAADSASLFIEEQHVQEPLAKRETGNTPPVSFPEPSVAAKERPVLPDRPAKAKSAAPRLAEEKTEPVSRSPETKENTQTKEKKEDPEYIPPPEEAPKTVSEQKVSEQKVSLENISVSLALDETVSSDDPAVKGKSISFKVTNDVFSQGVKVVAAGTTATGRILKVRSSGSGKSFLEIRPESVRAVNGVLLKLKSPPLGRSGSSTEPVIFSKGTLVSPAPRIINKSIQI